MSPSEILPGAEPFSAAGGSVGVLVLHGFTGNPQSLRGLAQAFADAGFTVELPLLPGHGTSLDDMEKTGWDDWYQGVEMAYAEIADRCSSVIVAGLSLGGSLAVTLAVEHPEVAALVLVNPAVEVTAPGSIEFLEDFLAQGVERIDALGSDIADPDAVELSYSGTPVRPLISALKHYDTLPARLGELRCPILLFTSTQDHVVDPHSSETLAAAASGPVERVTLERSFHVATLDYDKDEIERRAVEFARRITG